MRTPILLLFLVLALLAAACGEEARGSLPAGAAPRCGAADCEGVSGGGASGRAGAGDAARPPRSAAEPGLAAGFAPTGGFVPTGALAAGWTAGGQLALFDMASGTIVSQAASGGLGGDVDVAWDPWGGRVLVVEGDAEGQWGEIASHAVSGEGAGAELGERHHEVWLDGVARVAASPLGAVLFEEGAAAMWKLIPAAGAPTPGLLWPRPISVEMALSASGDLAITGLTRGLEGNSLDVRTAIVAPGGVQAISIAPISVFPASDELSVRRVRSAVGEHLAAALSGDVGLSTLGPAGFSAPEMLGTTGVEGIEDAISLPGAPGAGPALVLLTSGSADLVVARLGEGGAVECFAALDLPGKAARAPGFFARSLVAAGPDRVLVATSAGVAAVSISGLAGSGLAGYELTGSGLADSRLAGSGPASSVATRCPLVLAVAPGFEGDALRGPLSPLTPP
jgi:hypothetical protein